MSAQKHQQMLLVLDTADEGNSHKMPDHCGLYPRQLDKAPKGPNVVTWLALHQPIWFLGEEEDSKDKGAPPASPTTCDKDKTDSALDALRKDDGALLRATPDRHISVILSGDTHLFQVFRPRQSALPVHIIAGMSGTALDALPKAADPAHATSYGVAGSAVVKRQHGFLILRAVADRWTIMLHDANGQSVASSEFYEADSPGRPALRDDAE
jgi:hypothetical protein